ncbi:cell wall hydrolase [Pseudomonas resinovorans]|uniref:Cell wall hydrolase n=1 Tax=Metapseudomonas resinovorans TaxID=53412 RepID=A0ABT4Y943_METRE|nr:cell wall hydrolase [Pseudomonas resinovorans]MDA8485147.1 cell wall hydrolase [Pseudomonas resinovorans]
MGAEKEIDVLARTLWGEARGEGLAGMIAVGWTIRNRVELDLRNDGKPDWWGEGYIGVCQKPWQFSCWNKNDPNYPFLSGLKPIPAAEFAKARQAALAVLEGKQPDPTAGATHYYAKSMKTPPGWMKGARPTVTIGNHRFFKDVP